MTKAVLGIIGGSASTTARARGRAGSAVDTPWGEPSDALRIGRVGDTQVVFLPRHGRGHRIPPCEINYRANIDALKRARRHRPRLVLRLRLATRRSCSPGTFVLVDNFVDRTVRRESSFFGTGCVAHVSFAASGGPALQDLVWRAAQAEGMACVRGGTAVCMEGPQFSTLAESLTYRALGYDIIHMTSCPRPSSRARRRSPTRWWRW